MKAVFFSLFFPILLRTVVTYQNLFLWFFWELWLWMLRIALKTAWGLFFSCFWWPPNTGNNGYEHVWWFLRHCKRKLAPYWVTFIKITISRPSHFKSIEKPRVFFMFLFLFWNKFVKLQKFAQKNIGCNYIWGLGAGGWQHLFWSKSKELSFPFNSKTLENMQFFIKESVKIWWFNVHLFDFSTIFFYRIVVIY